MAVTTKYKTPILWAFIGLIGGLLLAWLFFDERPGTVATAADDHAHAAGTVYTCSMHPQIRQEEPGLCPICGMELIPIQGGLEAENEVAIRLSPSAAALAGVETMILGESRFTEGVAQENQLQLSGQLQLAENRLYSQVAHFPGRIEQLYVNTTGENVRNGQAIASIYSPELLAAQQELLQAVRLNGQGNYSGLLKAAREKLHQFHISKAQIQRIEQEGHTFERLTIAADKAGVVTELMVAQGDHVNSGQPLFQLAQLDRLWVILEAYENQLPYLQLGDKLQLTIRATGKTYPATITFIDPIVNASSRTVKLRAELANPEGKLRPQMLVQAVVQPQAYNKGNQQTAADDALLLPRTAVLWTGERSVVYVKPESSKFGYEMREVSVQPAGESYRVTDGLTAGEEVVVNGAFVVDAAAQLHNKPSMMNRALQTTAASSPKQTGGPTFKTPPPLEETLSSFISAYLELKDRLVQAEPNEVRLAAQKLQQAEGAVSTTSLDEDAASYLARHRDHVRQTLAKLLQEKSIDGQRRYFIGLSEAVIALADAFPLPSLTLYQQFCPMADNDAGAYWLSNQAEIINPYYGDLMLNCGEIVKKF